MIQIIYMINKNNYINNNSKMNFMNKMMIIYNKVYFL